MLLRYSSFSLALQPLEVWPRLPSLQMPLLFCPKLLFSIFYTHIPQVHFSIFHPP